MVNKDVYIKRSSNKVLRGACYDKERSKSEEEEEEEIYLAQTYATNQMQIQIIYNTTEPGYRKTRRSTMPATLTHQLLEYQKFLKQLELYSN